MKKDHQVKYTVIVQIGAVYLISPISRSIIFREFKYTQK